MNLNEAIEKDLFHTDINRFVNCCRTFIDENKSISNYIYLNDLLGQYQSDHLKQCKIAILRSVTIEQIVPMLSVECFIEKIKSDIFVGNYNNYQQEVLDENSELYNFKPDIIILFVRLHELCPSLIYSFDKLEETDIIKQSSYAIETIHKLIKTLRHKTNAKIIVNNFDTPVYPNRGIYDYQDKSGQINTIRHINMELLSIIKKFTDVFIFDFENFASGYGKRNLYDMNMWYYAKNPFKSQALPIMVNEYMRYIKSINGVTKKCVVLDLDNTLWGGVIGEDGLAGIKLGHTYPGKTFVDFQKKFINLYNRGIIIALNSKNNYNDAVEVFEKHPDMQLTLNEVACSRINWNDKASNIREIAKELNIGLDSIVFFDDNPAEIELVKQELPEVKSIELKGGPINYINIFDYLTDFENLNITKDDKNRGLQYKQRSMVTNLEANSNSLDDFYKKLEMEAQIKEDSEFDITRISQLTQKTNQFNLTTKRYSVNDIELYMQSEHDKVLSLTLSDRFGDNGLTAVAILKKLENAIHIDTFLMSCRIMGRTAEQSLLAYIYDYGIKSNCQYIVGYYSPTAKNEPVRNFYKNFGFTLSEAKDGSEKWILDTTSSKIEYSSFIKMR